MFTKDMIERVEEGIAHPHPGFDGYPVQLPFNEGGGALLTMEAAKRLLDKLKLRAKREEK